MKAQGCRLSVSERAGASPPSNLELTRVELKFWIERLSKFDGETLKVKLNSLPDNLSGREGELAPAASAGLESHGLGL
jgi:hypothetical protein